MLTFDYGPLFAGDDDAPARLSSAVLDGMGPAGRTTANGISLQQILQDRPDVFAAYFTEYYGAGNDHHSSAWTLRVGGDGVEDYANYWYETYGKFDGYTPSNGVGGGGLSSPVEGGSVAAPTGGMTADGISLDQILLDRPDVYRAFFTEFYGPHNDHKSHAWMDRVGGETPQAYANYWYETYGKYSGYTPSTSAPPALEEPAPEPQPDPPAVEPDPVVVTPDPDPPAVLPPQPTDEDDDGGDAGSAPIVHDDPIGIVGGGLTDPSDLGG